MNSMLIDYYNAIFFEKAHQLKFKRNKNKYIRVINDVYQCFAIQGLSDKRATIEFGVLPMCMPYNYYGMLRYNLTQFLPLYDFFKYYEDENSIYKCVKKLYDYACSYMFPFFDNTTVSSSALQELLLLDKNIEQIRLENLKSHGISDCAPAFELRTIPYLEKYYFALKTENYEFIKQYFQLSTENYYYLINKYPCKKDELINKISINNESLQRIINNSYGELQELASNEAYNFKKLNRYVKK